MTEGHTGVGGEMDRTVSPPAFPPRVLAAGVAVALLADVPGLFTRGDLLRGAVVAFVASAAAALGLLLPARKAPSIPRGALLLLPLAVPLLALGADVDPTLFGTLRDAAPWIALAALGWGLVRIWKEEGDARRAWVALLGAGTAAALWVLADAALRGAPGAGPFGRPGIAGPVLAALLVAAAYGPFPGGRRIPRVLFLLVLGAATLATASRTGVLAGALGLALGGWLTAAGGRRRAGGVGLGAAAAGVLLLLALAAAGAVRVPGGGDTLEVRFGVYRAGARLVAERPVIGHGLGSFRTEILRVRDVEEAALSRGRRPTVAHDDYLHVATEGGIPAALALLAFVGGVVAVGLGRRRRGALDATGAGALAAFATIALAALGEDVLLDPAGVLVAGLAAATVLGFGRRETAIVPAPLAAAALGGLTLLALGAAGVRARDTLADAALRRYRDAIRGDVSPLDAIAAAQDHLREGALRWRDDLAEAHYRLGVHHAEFERWKDAREAFRDALRCDAGMTEAWLDIARTYEVEGKWEDAQAALDAATESDPTRYDVRIRLGHLALGPEPVPGDADALPRDAVTALRSYNEAARLAPDRFETLVARARLERRRGQLANAGALLREALERVAPDVAPTLRAPLPEDAVTDDRVARLAASRVAVALGSLAGRPEAGEVLLESFRLAEREEGTTAAWESHLLALALAVNPAMGRAVEREAERFFVEARRREENGDAGGAGRAYDAAALRWAGLLRTGAVAPAALLARAVQEEEAKAWRRALALRRALLAWAQGEVPPPDGAAEPERLERLAELAIDAAQVASRVDGTLGRALYAQGHTAHGAALLRQGRWQDARRVLLRAADQAPDDAGVRLGLARAHVRLDELDEAEAAVLEALRLAPRLAPIVRTDPDLLRVADRPAVQQALR